MKRKQKKQLWLIAGGAVVLVMALLLAWRLGLFASARSTTAGIILAQGERYEIVYTTSATVPRVKLEICRGTRCQTLAGSASGTRTTITVPRNYALGAAFFKVMERNTAGQLTGRIQRTIPIVVIAAANNPDTETDDEEDNDQENRQDSNSQPNTNSNSTTPPASTTNTGGSSSSNTGGGIVAVATPTRQAPTPVPTVVPLVKFYYACVTFEGTRNGQPFGTIKVSWQGPRDGALGFRPVGVEEWQYTQPQRSDQHPRLFNLFGFAPESKWKLGYGQDYELRYFNNVGGPKIPDSLIKTFRANTGPPPSPYVSRTRCPNPVEI